MICNEIQADRPISNVGDLLRDARNEHHISDVSTIARELCIKPNVIEALEKGKFDSFPSACYAKGFLKSYASYLGLNTKDIISKYEKEFSGSKEVVVLAFPAVKRRKFSMLSLVGATSVCVAIFAGVWTTSSPLDAEELSGISLAVTQSELQEAPTVNVPAVENIQLAVTKSEEPTPAFATSNMNIELQAKEDVWIRISKNDGSTLVEQVLAKGATFTHPQEAGLVLMTNNAAAISLTLGATVFKSLGEQGEIIESMTLEQEKLLELSMVH
jgi:cytoskeleton protein RodZ